MKNTSGQPNESTGHVNGRHVHVTESIREPAESFRDMNQCAVQPNGPLGHVNGWSVHVAEWLVHMNGAFCDVADWLVHVNGRSVQPNGSFV